ncbi:MAG: chemotaxis protein CheB [Cellvibrionaceae bacterium]
MTADENDGVRLGVLAATNKHRQSLIRVANDAGFSPVLSVSWSELQAMESTHKDAVDIDAWLVAVDCSDEEVVEPLHDWIDAQSVPVIVDHELGDDHLAAFNEDWCRRIKDKLIHLPGIVSLHQSEYCEPEQVWVLAASTGGPEAVSRFLKALPPSLNIAFIYAQHIEANFDSTLVRTVERNSDYRGVMIADGHLIKPSEVAIVSPAQQAKFCENGSVAVFNKPWLGPYQPSIDGVIASIALLHKKIAGVIVFSGMGDDGAKACRIMSANGGQVWVQTPETCTVDSMPVSVLATGCVDFEGTPEELATRLGYWRSPVRNIGGSIARIK